MGWVPKNNDAPANCSFVDIRTATGYFYPHLCALSGKVVAALERGHTSPHCRCTRRFRLPSLHILHVRCQFCVIRAVRRNLQFLPVWVRLRKKSIVQRDGQAQERAQVKLERNRRWFERKISTFLVREANAPVRAANAPYGELHTSTDSRSSYHERGEHTTKRRWSGRGPGQSRSSLRRPKALRWSVRLSSFDTSFCSGRDSTDIVKTSLLACSWR